jgi:hypothetical protein
MGHVVGVRAEDVEWDEVSRSTRISRSELACKMGHASAYAMAPDSGWLLVCEDDAQLDLALVRIALAEVERVPDAVPTVMSLYLGPWSVVRVIDPSEPLLECITPPDGAVCYLINRAARSLAAERWERLRPADWPLWARHCRFVILPGGALPLPGAHSMIEADSGRHRRASSSGREAIRRFAQLSGLVLLSSAARGTLSVGDWWYWEIRQRLAWRFPGRFGAVRSATFLADQGFRG